MADRLPPFQQAIRPLEVEVNDLFERLVAKTPKQRIQELERVIVDALAASLRIDASKIKTDESLVSLGLDSLIGMILRSKLESALQTELPTFGLSHEPTVNGLARAAADSFESQSKDASVVGSVVEADLPVGRRVRRRRSGVVALGGAHGTQAPMFCLHPVGGDLRCYDKLARHMTSRPVYGLRSRGLDAYSDPHDSMEELIEDYADEVQRTSGSGSVCLLGWSTGGIFARELAIRLEEMGRDIESLIMIDTPLPSVFEDVDLEDNSKFLSDLVTFTNYFAGTSMQIDPRSFDGLPEDEALHRVLELGIGNGVLPSHATSSFLIRLISVCKQHVRILRESSPSLSPTRAILIRPADASVLSKAAGKDLPHDLGWGQYTDATLHSVSGHHFTMMTSEYAAEVAGKIEQLISQP